jgi:transcriptional regulator with XRE-family HTH domain
MSMNNTMKTLRIFLGLSVREWARKCGVSPAHVSLVESDQRIVTEEYVKKVLKAMPIDRTRLYQAVPVMFTTAEREQIRALREALGKLLDAAKEMPIHKDLVAEVQGVYERSGS